MEEKELSGTTPYGDEVHLRVYDDPGENIHQIVVSHSNLCGYFSVSFTCKDYATALSLYNGFMGVSEYDVT